MMISFEKSSNDDDVNGLTLLFVSFAQKRPIFRFALCGLCYVQLGYRVRSTIIDMITLHSALNRSQEYAICPRS